MPLLKRRSVFAAKTETTIGTAEALAGADGAFNVRNQKFVANIPMTEREGQGGFNYLPSVPSQRGGTVTFTTDAFYDGTTIPTWATVLLPGCGFINTAGLFAPLSREPGASVKTLTIGGYYDGKFYSLAGCAGTFVINCPTGDVVSIDWTFQGKFVSPSDVTLIAPTYPTTMPMRMAAGSFSWASASLCTKSCTVDAGNEVILRECAGEVTGIKSGLIVSRKPMITADPEMVLVATQNRHSQWLTPTTGALVITTGAGSENRLTITAAVAQIQDLQEGDRNKMLTDDIKWLCCANGSTPDTELTIDFTEGV